MADPVTFTIDGRTLKAAPGTLLINVAKQAGIEIPAFCYYDGLALQAACRMCLVEIEKMPKLQPACTMPVAEGMVVYTDSAPVKQARKGMLEFLLTNHPLDCPVLTGRDANCRTWHSATARARAGLSRSSITTDGAAMVVGRVLRPGSLHSLLSLRPICDEGIGVKALSVGNRGVSLKSFRTKATI